MSAKTAIVTGAAAGIGRGITFHLAARGWRVAGIDIDRDALHEVEAALPAGQFLNLGHDAGVEAEVASAFDAIATWQPGAALLVNNAGIADPVCGPLEDLTLDAWQGWIDASLTAAFLCSRAALPLLRAQPGASIVNIASTRALQSEPDTYAYAAAKGGLCALTHAMAVGLGPGIRVNAVLPGWIETGPWQKESERSEANHRKVDREQHPAGRVGTVEDIAETVAWLASEAAGFITGQQIVVDGGMTRKMIYAG